MENTIIYRRSPDGNMFSLFPSDKNDYSPIASRRIVNEYCLVSGNISHKIMSWPNHHLNAFL